MADDALDMLAAELARALQPLAGAASSADATKDFLRLLGWEFANVPAAVEAVRAPVQQLYQLVESEGAAAPDAAALFSGVRAAFAAISDISAGAGLPGDFAGEFPRQLVDHLVCEYLLVQRPRFGYALLGMGLLRLEDRPAAGIRPAYRRRSVMWEELGSFVEDPLGLFRDAYAWGDSGFRGPVLQSSLTGLLRAWGADVRATALEQATLDQLNVGATAPLDVQSTVLRVVLLKGDSAVDYELGVGMFLLPETPAVKPGFALMPYGTAGFTEDVELSEIFTLQVGGTASLDGGLGALVRPGRDLEFMAGFGPGTPSAASGTVTIALLAGEEGTPTLLIGSADATRFQLAGASVLGGVRFHSGGSFEVFAELGVVGAKLVVKPGPDEQDGFLAQLLPGDGMTIGTDLTVGFSTTRGLYFGGSGGLEIAIPAHIQLGPIEILGALMAVKFTDEGIPVELAASLKGDLSVLTAVVENIGVTAMFTFPPDGRGNLGPANLEMRFRPPNGVGLTVDAGVVRGGGYLYLDFEKGEYAGALELTIADFLSVKAIGLINTKLPGGRDGFSLLIIITAEFTPGFQLGFGFTLAGVGGLVGLNRAMLLEPLVAGIRTGAINSIVFPTNVVENAPRIISDLRTIFPPEEGTFLIGPMAKIGWGTPTLISLSLGVIIEIPGNVVILGRLRLALPTDEEALVVMQVSFLGAIEFDKRRVWFFASLFESRILFITIDGELGLLMDFSDTPAFLLSIGGFHPRYQPPPLPFPKPARLALSIIDESFARVRVDAYFAVTSNSVQAGARAEAFFGFSALSVEGYFSFDALLRFSPFYLIVEVSAGFSVKVFGMGVWGIHLRGSLEGPAPWHITGAASIEFLFFSISVDVDVTFGERHVETLPPLPVLPALKAELEKLDSWRTQRPGAGRLLVSLRQLGDSELLVLHPVGSLEVSQRLVPLGVPLEKVGNQKPSDIASATVGVADTSALKVTAPAKELFAAAQYRDMDDAAKLSAPAYQLFQSGVALAAPATGAWRTGPGAQRTVRYETIVVDTPVERVPLRFFRLSDGLFTHFAHGGAIARNELSLAKEQRLRPFDEVVAVQPDRYVVANLADNTAIPGASAFASHTEAAAYAAQAVRADPNLADAIHVIPAAEVNVTV
jgi:Family of unknown function (DUF6603)